MKMQTSLRVDDKFYEESKEVFSKLGLTFTDAVNIFLAKVAMEKKIPFELAIEPSDELKKRVKNIENKKNIQSFKNSDELFDELGI
ncbi:type II toxin-antitoxin system RelB/DinJ family antitoxin [Aliarcobacter butzleri]|uniref:type II toxin-antitoxin system RelB/DinJ family antitoxin n=1 Tax=Aliarcobacter butzleri TaxID=28197 RepID=UPI00215A0F88|nr:type II toxin-antitoxin system RelB/DinJ family antitoxin [Aliarcobacter butzleri]MCR8711193.1 type II toxin-antitoxin system RelB/DinJ family antitoxin [Aliarcobacter butzleri]